MVKRFVHVCALITSLTCVTVTDPPQPSLVVTFAMSTSGTWLAQLTVTAAGQLMLGAVWSFTVMICVQRAKLPHASVALWVRVRVKGFVHVCALLPSLTCVPAPPPPQPSLVT